MGAITYTITAQGNNVREVFNELVEEALGNDPYNGTITTTILANKLNLPKEVQNAKNKKKAMDEFLMDNEDFGFVSKRKTRYVNLGPVRYESYVPQWVSDAHKPKVEKGVKTEKKFSVVRSQNIVATRFQAGNEFQTITEAKKYAKEQALKTGEDFTIMQHRLNGRIFQVGHMNLIADGKTYKTPCKLKTKVIKCVNEYIFFVYAAS